MSHHVATLQSAFDKTASALVFAYALAERVYWLDDTYVQPISYSWAAPRLREAAISGIYWALVTLIDVSLWLIDTTRQFMARDAQAIALDAFAQAHEPLPELLALCPSVVPMALPSMAPAPVFPSPVVPWVSTSEALDDAAPILALCPSVVPMDLTQFLNPDHSVRCWLTIALPLAIAHGVTESLTVSVNPAVAPVVKKTRKSKATDTKTEKPLTDKTPRKRSPKTTAAAQ